MEFEEQEGEIRMSMPPGYDANNSTSRSKMVGDGTPAKKHVCKYKECLKNHAVSIGGHAVDGCGEFMPAGDDGTLEALKCAACNCHRNFHRKESDTSTPPHLEQIYRYPQHHYTQFWRAQPPSGFLHLTPQHRPLALPAVSAGGYSREEEDVSNPSSSGGGGGSKKRFRTKFSQEQKEKMLGFSEKLGWRIQKHDEATVEQFCAESGVKRQVLKVWMHNNKHTLGKKP